MKIFDCFQFFDENMMLDLRLNVLNQYVDHFVIVENLYMHNGKKKKQNFDIKNFNKFKDKIIYILLDELPKDLSKISGVDNHEEHLKILSNAHKIEKKQRNTIIKGLDSANDDDLIFFSDVDEIPNLKKFRYRKKITVFEQKMIYYKFNLVYPNFIWMGTKACKMKDFKSAEWLRNIKAKKYPWWRADTFFSEKKYSSIEFVKDGGWHFTNIKDAKDIDFKMRNFAHHLEYEKSGVDLDKLKNNIENKTVFYDHLTDKSNLNKHNAKIRLDNLDLNQLPSYINENINLYKKWID